MSLVDQQSRSSVSVIVVEVLDGDGGGGDGGGGGDVLAADGDAFSGGAQWLQLWWG